MNDLESALERARGLDTDDLADSIQEIGFECTRCGHCCTGDDEEPHTATIFPDEVRSIAAATTADWAGVARPIPYGLSGRTGETFEWALQTDSCGDCRFLAEQGDGTACTIYADRPLICQTYPFSVTIGLGTDGPEAGDGDERETQGTTIAGHSEGVVETVGSVRAHDCEGLGSDINRDRAEELATRLKERTIEEVEQALAVRAAYDPEAGASEPVVVHDSEGAKRPDGSWISTPEE